MIDEDRELDPELKPWAGKLLRGLTAFFLGAAFLDTGLSLLDVHIELFSGIDSYGLSWLVAMTLLPFLSGWLVGRVYGFGGKYLAHFPPFVVLVIHYYESVYTHFPAGVHILPWPLWGFFTILLMEFSAFGAIFGELRMRRQQEKQQLPKS